MKRIITFMLMLSAMATAPLTTVAGESTNYYSQATAKAVSGAGKVYVSTSDSEPAESDFKTEDTKSITSTSKSHTYTLYARPDNEMVTFDHWELDGTNVSSSAIYSATFEVSSTNGSSPTSKNYMAYFKEATGVTVNCDTKYGSVKLSNPDNKVGDEVTMTVTPKVLDTYGCRNMMIEFEGWMDADGNLLSTEPTYTMTVTRPQVVTATFRNNNSLKTKGYYRVRNIFDRVLAVEGSYVYQIGLRNNFLDGLLRFAMPDDIVKSDFNNKSWNATDYPGGENVESMPSTVMLFEGENLDVNAAPNGDALQNVTVFAQGTDTKTMTENTLTIKPSDASKFPGYHILYGGFNAGLKMTHRESDETENDVKVHKMYCSALLGNCKYDDPYSAMALQPIDEEHFDRYYFGASASEAMAMDGGYWTTMYASFPYECRDGVEAYYVGSVETVAGHAYAMLEKIEGGIVPAGTPVILKCRNLDTRHNRLMPLLPDGTNSTPIEGNLLKGEYQLYTDKERNGRVSFDPDRMRVLSVDSHGTLGFYTLMPDAEGKQQLLAANKAYLDISTLPAATSVSLRMADSAGIYDIRQTDAEADSRIFDLYGREVKHPVAGTLYIINGKKTIYK